MLADGLDTIHLDIWMTIIPSNNFTAELIWKYIEPPAPLFGSLTFVQGYPMNATFLNATQYKACPAALYSILSPSLAPSHCARYNAWISLPLYSSRGALVVVRGLRCHCAWDGP